MKPRTRHAVPTLLTAALLARDAHATPEQAAPSDGFVASAGVNAHFDFADTPYVMQYPRVRAALLDAGFVNIRTAVLGDVHSLATHFVPDTHIADLATAGVHLVFLCDLGAGSPATCHDLVRAFNTQFPGAVVAVEGPNEPDGFWARLYPSGYMGHGFPAGAIAFQRDLYAALRADPATAMIPVYGIALGLAGAPPCSNSNPLGNAGELSPYVDFGNFHPYPSGNPWHPDIAYDFTANYYHECVIPSGDLDPTPSAGLTAHDDVACMAHKPYGTRTLVATESGAETTADGTGAPTRIAETSLAAIEPRILLENYRLGIARTLLYELLDTGGEYFGLLRADLTPRPSFGAVRTLLHQLADPGPAFSPGSLDYDLAVQPVTLVAGDPTQTFDRLSYVHHLLFAKRDGTFELVLWHEIATDHTYPAYRSLTPPPLPAMLTVHAPFASASVTTVDATGAPSTRSVDPSAAIALAINERFQVVELVPRAAHSPDAGAPRDGATAVDAAAYDAAPADSAHGLDGGSRATTGAGCGCRTASGVPSSSAWATRLTALALAAVARRRRRAR